MANPAARSIEVQWCEGGIGTIVNDPVDSVTGWHAYSDADRGEPRSAAIQTARRPGCPSQPSAQHYVALVASVKEARCPLREPARSPEKL